MLNLQDGTLLDELDRLAVEGRKLSSRQVLEMFRQVGCWFSTHTLCHAASFQTAAEGVWTWCEHDVKNMVCPGH